MSLIKKITNFILRRDEDDVGLEWLLDNLERESIQDHDSHNLRIWNSRRSEEKWDLGNRELVHLNIQSFMTGYLETKLFRKHGYFIQLKSINYVHSTATFIFKNRLDIRTATFHIFDFERVLRGCNDVIGYNIEHASYLQEKLLGKLRDIKMQEKLIIIIKNSSSAHVRTINEIIIHGKHIGSPLTRDLLPGALVKYGYEESLDGNMDVELNYQILNKDKENTEFNVSMRLEDQKDDGDYDNADRVWDITATPSGENKDKFHERHRLEVSVKTIHGSKHVLVTIYDING